MCGGQADGFGLVDVGVAGGGEPGVELGEGGGVELGALEGTLCILVRLRGGIGAGGSNWDGGGGSAISLYDEIVKGVERTDEFGGGRGCHSSGSEETDGRYSHKCLVSGVLERCYKI